MDISLLREIGLTDSEVKVYLALLQLGTTTRGKLVAESKISGSKIYDNLERLQQKGLVASYLENNVRHFKSISPTQILAYLESKNEQIAQTKTKVSEQMPQLLALFEKKSQEQEVELISGLKGLNAIFQDQVDKLKKGDTCYVIGGTKGSDEEAVVAFFEKVHVMREEKGIKTLMLFNNAQRKSTLEHYATKKFPHTQTRFITHSSPVAINIYGAYVAIIIFGEKITAIRIKSIETAKSFEEYFKLLWNTARK